LCLLKSSKRPKPGTVLLFEHGVSGVVQDLEEDGLVRIAFHGVRSLDSFLEAYGHMPLPPYIKRDGPSALSTLDRERYQTVFSRRRGAVAAPTAGLHFSESLIKDLDRAGVKVIPLTLHVGHGTFRPVRTQDIRQHRIGEEYYHIHSATAEEINRTKERGDRVIAVGTTVVRALETARDSGGFVQAGEGRTGLLITPGFEFRVLDGLITNFHLPRTSLLFLVAAFAGIENTHRAYAEAIQRGYRFYSYGDAMLIL
jgi:S-adenosylmethionine:tRNA ribosyltransferase-isomerase